MGQPIVVSDLMTPEVATLDANDRLSIADDVMRLGRIRHMPVVDEDRRVIGMVSQRDLFRGALARSLGYGDHAQTRVLEMLVVKEVMTTQVLSVRPDAPISEAARLMLDRKVGSLVVLDDDGRLVGILTETDFVRALVRREAGGA